MAGVVLREEGVTAGEDPEEWHWMSLLVAL